MKKDRKPNGYWTLETSKEEAKKYQLRSEFKKGSSGCYDFCLDNKILDIVCKHMFSKNKPRNYWTLETAKEEAKKYQLRSEFVKGSSGCYDFCFNNNILDIVCEDMLLIKKPNNYWTKELVIEEAKKYNSRLDFQKGCGSAYKFCLKENILEVFEHMEIKGTRLLRFVYIFEFKDNHVYVGLTYNTKERYQSHLNKDNSPVYRHIEKTNTKFEFKVITELPIYCIDAQILEHETIQKYQELGWNILNKGKTGKGCGSLGRGTRKWTEENIKTETNNYKTRSEFRKNSSGAYVATSKIEGLLDKLYPPSI